MTAISSSTHQYPTPQDVYRHLITDIQRAGGGLVTFWDKANEDRWIQVQAGGEGIALNLSYPYPEEPVGLLARLGIALPPGFYLFQWDQEFSTSTIREGPGPLAPPQLDQLVDALHAIFIKVYRASPAYIVEGQVDECEQCPSTLPRCPITCRAAKQGLSYSFRIYHSQATRYLAEMEHVILEPKQCKNRAQSGYGVACLHKIYWAKEISHKKYTKRL